MAVDYVWGGSLYQTRAAMLDAIAAAWATAWGRNSQAETLQAFEKKTDAELAEETIDAWGLDSDAELCAEGDTHMTRFGYTAADLAAAFGRLRERLGEAAPGA